MKIREFLEEKERNMLSPYAAKSSESKGRSVYEQPCDLRTDFARDRDRILHSKSFRRLNNKTQVFLAAQGDHYRTRLTHTLEVAQIARTIAKALSLNEDLTEAIALGHDLGHTPFGHSGERALTACYPGGFRHNEQSVRVVEVLERDGTGLNLTWEVKDGILNHKTSGQPVTLEGQIVRLSDKIAYMHHDMDDAIRAGVISENDIPITIHVTLGETNADRLDTMVRNVIDNSMNRPKVAMSDEIREASEELRQLMFKDVYVTKEVRREEEKAAGMIRALYDLYMKQPDLLSAEYRHFLDRGEDLGRVVCDYISGMTDQYCIHKYTENFVLKGWEVN